MLYYIIYNQNIYISFLALCGTSQHCSVLSNDEALRNRSYVISFFFHNFNEYCRHAAITC
jgi:hypothetical protein